MSVEASELVAQVDEIGDLIAFDPSVGRSTRKQFLADASERLSRGESVYTVRDGNKLIHYGWIKASPSSSRFTEVEHEYEYPEPGAVLYDFFTHPMSRGRQLYQKTVRQMLNDIATSLSPPACIYISVLADNAPWRQVIEEMGFRYHESVVRLARLFAITWHVQRF